MSKRKIWSAPLAALVLVLVLAAMVFAQTPNVAPEKGVQIPDVTLTVAAAAATDTTDLTDPAGDGSGAAFTDATTGDQIAITAATTNERVADVALVTPATDSHTAWWDSLGGLADDGTPNTNGTDPDVDCSKRAAALGFTAGTPDQTDADNRNRAGRAADAGPPSVTVLQATGFCADYTDINTNLGDNPDTTETETDYGIGLIADAFHWDMLTGQEMIEVARGQGESNPSAYGHKFGGLSAAGRLKVSGWFDSGVLAAGTASLAVSNDGIDVLGANNDLPDDSTPDGTHGTATIYVRASDGVGRFVTGPNTSDAAGQSFTVTASLTETGAITAFTEEAVGFTAPDAGAVPSQSVVTAVGVEGASTGVSFVPAADADAGGLARYDLTIGTGAEGAIARVHAVAGVDLQAFHQKLEFILRGNDNFLVRRATNPVALQYADIVLKSGTTLNRDDTFDMTLQVNELGNVGANNQRVALRVLVVEGGEAPMLDTAALDAHFDANPVKVREHTAGDDNVATDGLPIDLASFATHGGGQALTYSISSNTSSLTIDSSTGMVTLSDPTTGATYDTTDGATNTETVTLTADDGTRTADYEFTVTITTNKAQANVALDTVSVVEGDAEATPPTVDTYFITDEVNLRQDDRGKTAFDIKDYITGVDDPDTLIYAITQSKPEFTIGTNAGDSEVVLSYVPDPDDVDYGSENTLTYSGNDALVVTIRDNFPTVVPPAEHEVDLTFTVNLTVNVEPPPQQQYPVANASIDEDTMGEVLAADNAALTRIIGDEDVTVAHAGGSGAGELDADGNNDNFVVDEETGAVALVKAGGLDYEVDGASHTLTLSVVRDRDETLLGSVTVLLAVNDVNEEPVFDATDDYERAVAENAQTGTAVGAPVVASDEDAGSNGVITFSVEGSAPFNVSTTRNDDGTYGGQIMVSGAIAIADSPYTVTVKAADGGGESVTQDVEITLGDINDPPTFDAADATTNTNIKARTIAENSSAGTIVATYTATDPDAGDVIQGVHFVLRDATDTENFSIANSTVAGESIGVLTVANGANLEYDIEQDSPAPVTYTIEVNVCDADNDCNELTIVVTLENSNDEDPVIGNTEANQNVPENSPRGTSLGDYGATDKDNLNQPGFDTITYTLTGTHGKYFQISDAGELMTLASLDYDRPVPCRTCEVTVYATDSAGAKDSQDVTITVTPVEDSVSTVDVSKANPVPGTNMGDADSALFGTKTTMAGQKDVVERPNDLPATTDPAPDQMNYVETAWANWGTVLRIEIIAESPQADCGNGNQCVVVNVNSDSADDSLKLRAYRSADQENKFVAAVKLVELSSDATTGDDAVYAHNGGGVPALEVDEEDEVEIEFGNLRDTIEVENEAPEVSNFAPEHERAFDDADVDYTFTITDDHSGLPEPEDLPDNDGDEDYTPVVALISKNEGGVGQCSVIDITAKENLAKVEDSTHIHEDDALYCPGKMQDGEYIASQGGFGFAPIRDDKDFDEIDDGYDVETTIVLTENDTYYVTFIVCDRAGNCAYHDPDGNDDDEELAEITVDTVEPHFVEARTGLKWDSTDNKYDDDRNYIQVIFNDLTTLNAATVEVDDFVVEGHTIVGVQVFENPDDDDVDWADSDRYAAGSRENLRHIEMYRDLENAVFIELADELLADETPDVTIVPNGVEDGAGNEQDDGDHEADDWISPKFTIVSITSTLSTDQDQVLAGDGDEVTLVVTSDERLDATRPTVEVTYVNAPAGSVDTKGTASCKIDADTNGTRDRGEIVHNDYCQHSGAAAGGKLNNHVEKVSNTEWIVTVTEPDDTGYYNFRIQGNDRSPQENPGSEGISADDIVTDFFDSDGDVNTDDAVFWEGDINLAKPNVRVSGNVITDNEPDIEYRSPLFVEIDFTRNHMGLADCGDDEDNDHLMANCTNENSEYAEDNFDDVVITMFELDGVDLTDSVKTTDDQTFLVTLENVSIGDHTAKIQAMDVAGNTLEDVLEIDFEVSDRDPFERRLNPGWNLVSLPGEPADSSIGSVFGPGVEVRTVYTYDPVVPGGWMVAVRETLESDWQGDLTEISGSRGYWVLSDAIQDWEVSIPRLAGGAAGTGTPIQPPVIPLYAGWNLIPVTDISGNGSGDDTVSADVYLQSLDDGLDLARVLGFDTIRNQWETVLDPDMQMRNTLRIGSAYWIFVREAASLVPSGYVSGGGSD